jgi:hypothetical protein
LRRGDIHSPEQHALFGKGVEVWRFDVRVAIRADVRRAVIVSHDEQNVGTRTLLRFYDQRNGEQQSQ